MTINFVINPVAGGWHPKDTRLGGTEESVVRWAHCLKTKGHDVRVYHNSRDEYYAQGYFPYALYEPGDVCVNVKHASFPTEEPTVYLTNETNASELDLSRFACVIWPSQWCVDNIPVNNPNTVILPHGYDRATIYPDAKVPKQCFYASSPDRGLSTLLQAWPDVNQAHPDATLLLTYGAQAPSLPGVINLGDVDEATMDEIYRTSDVWCHPANGGELFCITGIKAQAAGCVPVVIPTMALQETVRHGFFARDAEHYAGVLIEALSQPELRDNVRAQMAREGYADWAASSDQLEEILRSVV